MEPPIAMTEGFIRLTHAVEHLADVATGLAHGLDRIDVPVLDEIDDVVAVRRLHALRAKLTRDRRARARASRHPRLPQLQGTSDPRATRT